MRLLARAKINLTLDVLGLRRDGYHELISVMQTLTLHDVIELAAASELTLQVEGAALPTDLENLALRAAYVLRSRAGFVGGAAITLKKRIPVAAGLAGGSADAAAVLQGLNDLWGLGLGPAELADLGAEIGSDVPFCLQGGTALVRGRGEHIEPLPDLPPLGVVLVKPSFGVSTREVFRRYDVSAQPGCSGSMDLLPALPGGDGAQLAAKLGNDLESVTMAMHPQVGQIKQLLLDAGAWGAVMSGSGPTVFGLFPDQRRAHLGAARLPDGDYAVLVSAFSAR